MTTDAEGLVAIAVRMVVDTTTISAAAWMVASLFASSPPAVRRGIWIGGVLALWGVVVRTLLAFALPSGGEAPIDGRYLIESSGAFRIVPWLLASIAGVSVLRFARVVLAVWRLARLDVHAWPLEGEGVTNANTGQGRGRAPRLVAGPVGSAPSCFGIITGTIILPVSAREWPPDYRRMVLMHEREHLRRHDPQLHVLAELLKALLWFHPGVSCVVQRLALERELACDRATVNEGVDPFAYAEAMLFVAQRCPRRLPLATGVVGGSRLAVRLEALIGPPPEVPSRGAVLRHAALTLAVMLVVACILASRPLVAVEAGERWKASSVDGASGSHPGSFRQHALPRA